MPIQHRIRLVIRSLIFAALLCCLFASIRPMAGQKPYHIIDKWKLGGEGGWDYLLVDPQAHRLYMTRGAHVDVVDSQTGTKIGSIANLHGTHGIAFDTAGKFGYISDGGGNAVVVFDRTTLATVATIAAGQNPDGLVFEPATQTVWAFNGRSHDASVIDASQNKLIATIPLSGKPEFPAVDGKGTVYVNIEDKNTIARLDANSKKQTAEWPLIGCDGPSGLAFDIAGGRLFSVCGGKKMAVTDAATGKSLATPDIGGSPDAANWDPTHKLAFSSNGAGTLSVIDASAVGYPNIEELPTQRGARTMTYDPVADRIFLVTADFGPPPAPTAQNPHSRPASLPGSFIVIVVGR